MTSPPEGDEETAITFLDLAAQRVRLEPGLSESLQETLHSGHFIMGPDVHRLEDELQTWTDRAHVVTCASGTDALVMSLMALGLMPGDVVAVPAFTFAATAEAVVLAGGRPAFVDCVKDGFNIDAASLQTVARTLAQNGGRLRGVIGVDLFGVPCDAPALRLVTEDFGVPLVIDGAQSFGATRNGVAAMGEGVACTTSFFPAKPLGAYGDGGAIFTDDEDLAEVLRSVREHGAGASRYENIRIGMNGRLDTMQAVVLLAKLSIFASELDARRDLAGYYSAELADIVTTPVVPDETEPSWAQYTLVVDERDAVRMRLAAAGVPTQVYYPIVLHRQAAYEPYALPGSLPVAEHLSDHVLSLPMHPYITEQQRDRIVAAVKAAVA